MIQESGSNCYKSIAVAATLWKRLLRSDCRGVGLQSFFLLDKEDDLSIKEYTASKSYVLQDGHQLTEFIAERNGYTMTLWLIMMHDWQLIRQDQVQRIEIDGKMHTWSQALQEMTACLDLRLNSER